MKNNLGLSEEQVSEILYGSDVYTEDDQETLLFEHISDRIVDSDQEKGSTTHEIVIKGVATGKYFKSQLRRSPWIHQDEENARAKWIEVLPKQKTITEYE
jgi:hypothetical protein